MSLTVSAFSLSIRSTKLVACTPELAHIEAEVCVNAQVAYLNSIVIACEIIPSNRR